MNLISSMDQLDELLAVGSKEPILLGGELVFITNDIDAFESLLDNDDEQYIQQPPRLATRGGFAVKNKKKLYVAVSKEAVASIASYKGKTFLLADQYLAYGLSQRANCIVIGGGVTSVGLLNLEVFVFTHQSLEATYERNVQPDGVRLDIALQDILAQYADHEIFWCDPLGDPLICDLSQRLNFKEVGAAPLKSLVPRKLFSKAQSVDESLGWFPAVSLALVGALALGGSIGLQWARLGAERAEYQSEIAGYEEAYKNSSQSLDLLRHREFLLKAKPGHEVRIAKLDLMLRQVALLEGVIIHRIRFYDEVDPRASTVNQAMSMSSEAIQARDDFYVEFSVPQVLDVGSARDQAEPLLAALNNKTGMTVRVMDHAEENIQVGDADHKYWRYRLGGNDK